MPYLRDVELGQLRKGRMVFPSSVARKEGSGGYTTLDYPGRYRDSDLFPAMLLDDPCTGDIYVHPRTLLTPAGVVRMNGGCLVSVDW